MRPHSNTPHQTAHLQPQLNKQRCLHRSNVLHTDRCALRLHASPLQPRLRSPCPHSASFLSPEGVTCYDILLSGWPYTGQWLAIHSNQAQRECRRPAALPPPARHAKHSPTSSYHTQHHHHHVTDQAIMTAAVAMHSRLAAPCRCPIYRQITYNRVCNCLYLLDCLYFTKKGEALYNKQTRYAHALCKHNCRMRNS